MQCFQLSLVFLLLFFFLSEGSKNECLGLGFNPAEVKCNSCEAFSKVSFQLQALCIKCCTPLVVAPKESFALIVLEVDKRFVDGGTPLYPEVSRLIKRSQESNNKDSKSPYSNFAIRFVFGARPILRLFKERDDEFPDDSVSVGAWSEHVIDDFLKENIVQSSS